MNKHGFTMVEVTLFLAISSLLSVIAIIGLGPRFRNVRFSESIRDLESNIQKELFRSNSVNNRPDLHCALDTDTTKPLNIGTGVGVKAGEAGDCVLNGQLLVFNNDLVTYQYQALVSRREAPDGCLPADPVLYQLLACYQTTIVGSTVDVSQFSYLNGVKKISAPPAENAIAYFQDPGTGQQYLFGYSTIAPPYDTNKPMRLPAPAAPPAPQIPAPLGPCLQLEGGSNRRAAIKFTTNVLKPEVEFDGC